MKDKEWLINELKELRESAAESEQLAAHKISEESFKSRVRTLDKVLYLIGQMDEPDEREQLENAYGDMLKRQGFEFGGKDYVVVEKSETLSEDFILKHERQVEPNTHEWYVNSKDLKNLIVNEPETLDLELGEDFENCLQMIELAKQIETLTNWTLEDVKEKAYNGHLKHVDGNQVIVTKPEIPQFVADYVEWYVMNKKEWLNERRDIYHLVGVPTEYKEFDLVNPWAQKDGNTKKLIDAFYYGYTIKKELLYNVEDKEHSLLCKWKLGNEQVVISVIEAVEDNLPFDALCFKLTEQEIKDYDKRYWAFRKPVDNHDE